MRSKKIYILIYFFAAFAYYFSYSGSYIETKRNKLIDEFYNMPTYGEIRIQSYSEGVMRSGEYNLSIKYIVNYNKSISAENYIEVLGLKNWAYKSKLVSVEDKLGTGYSFEKSEEKLFLYTKDIEKQKKQVYLSYYYK